MAKLAVKHNNYYKRVVFLKGKQKDFLNKIQIQLGLTLKEFANLAGVQVRSISDWKREKFSMSLPAVKRMCQKARIVLPKDIKIKDPFWYALKGSSIGGIAVYKKYGHIGGDSEYRRKKWYQWWEKEGKFRKHPIIKVCLPINIPKKSSRLAEFIGIILGDGGVSRRQVTITVHRQDDRDFAVYIKDLIRILFKVEPSSCERESVVHIFISRTKLVQFLIGMGLCIGSKVRHQVDVPNWIKSSEKYTKACLRGLFDTDGCFYVDRHLYKDKIYLNCAMNFTNRSLPILYFFKRYLKKHGFRPTQKTKFSIFLRREDKIINYFQTIGSSNPKHLEKFKQYFKNKHGGVPKWS